MMDSALVYLLLLAGVAIGWGFGYRFARQSKPPEPDWIPNVELLLAEANDVALERFLNVPQLDDDALDLLLKLGRSLREKGEADRAIHLHQSLFARTDLPKHSMQALELELAVDYAHAGLLDRAERLFLELLDSKGRVQEKAAFALVELYEEEGDWQQILDLHQRKKLPSDDTIARRVAHAACEMAEQARQQDDFLELHKLCKRALKVDPHCARAWVVQGDLAHVQGELREAVRCYLRAVDVDGQAIIHTLEPMVDCFRQLQDLDGLERYLGQHWRDTHYVPALIAQLECEAEQGDASSAISQLLQELTTQPSNQGFFALVELVMRHRQQLDKSQLLVVYGILRRIVESEPRFVCNHCGFKATEPHWRCPSCKSWSTLGSFVPQPPVARLKL
jgi:lipopolysaccharide biosynthesis regulator YciM